MKRLAVLLVLCVALAAQMRTASAQNLRFLPHRECPADVYPIPGLQPGFSLESATADRADDGTDHVLIHSSLPTSTDSEHVYPWNYLKKVDFIPESGLIGQSIDIHADVAKGPNVGVALANLKPGNYIVVLFVEDNSDFAKCDAYFAYSVGTVTAR